MKKINLFVCMLAIAGLGFTSCSDDDSSNTGNTDVEIAGTYDLREVNTQEATDFDEDGTLHINQMEESDCYNNSKVTFNADNTFTADMNGIIVNEDNGTSACAQTTVSGTWEIYAGTGANVVLRVRYEDDNGDNVVANFTKQGGKLTMYELFSEYPDRNAQGGAVYTNGDVEYIYDKR